MGILLQLVLDRLVREDCEIINDDKSEGQRVFIGYKKFKDSFLKTVYLVSKQWKYLIEKQMKLPTIVVDSNSEIEAIIKLRKDGFNSIGLVNIKNPPSRSCKESDIQSIKNYFSTFYNGYTLNETEWRFRNELYRYIIDPNKDYKFNLLKAEKQAETLTGFLQSIYDIVKHNESLLVSPGKLTLMVDQKFTPEEHQLFNELIFKLNITTVSLEGWNSGTQRTQYPIIIASRRIEMIRTFIDDRAKKETYLEHLFESNPNLKHWVTYCQDYVNYFPDSLCNHKNIKTIHLSSAHSAVRDFRKFLDLNKSIRHFSSETVFEDNGKTFTMRNVNKSLEKMTIFHPIQPLVKFLGDNIKNLPNLSKIATIPHYPVDFDDIIDWGYLFKRLTRPLIVDFNDIYLSRSNASGGKKNDAASQMEQMVKMMQSMSSMRGFGGSNEKYPQCYCIY